MMAPKRKIMLLQTRHIESISYLSIELLRAFPKDSYEITLVYLEKGEPDAGDLLADKCVFLGLDKTDYKGLRLKAIKTLGNFLQNNHFDVIIANMYKPINLLMQLRRKLTASLCVGIIHTFGEFDRWSHRLMMRWMLDSRWRIVAVSQILCDYLINAGCGLHKGNALTINNAIDVMSVVDNALEKSAARKALSVPIDGKVFGTLGRCVRGKRQMELIKSFHQFAGDKPHLYLVVIGNGELYAELEAYVVAHQLTEKIFLPGYVPQAVNYLRAFDVFVFPSEQEGFGLALLEAMALALPVIVNRVEPLVTIAGDAGVLVDTSDIDAFAKALDVCYQLPAENLMQKGLASYRRVCTDYDVYTYRKNYRDLIDSHFENIKYDNNTQS
jgi:glycosyltransferase involved in cell wall biosynthesis